MTKDRSGILNDHSLRQHVQRFNDNDYSHGGQFVPNTRAADWLAENIPLFECSDKQVEEIYHFRWWTFRKHLKQTEDGFVFTEFLPEVPWSGKHNTIPCPAGHHFQEARWLHETGYLDDYARFWFRGGGEPRRYSTWLAHAVHAYALVTGEHALAVDLLPDLIANVKAWDETRLGPDGLYWQSDDRDGGECSVAGMLSSDRTGYRASINSYLFADALAIARIAGWAGKPDVAETYTQKAEGIRRRVMETLWDAEAEFFKVLPRTEGVGLADVREQHGYTPWYFGLPPAGQGYETAWRQLMDPKGFLAPYGPTTAEQRHPGFSLSYKGHECQWNGPSWPFATSITLTAMATVLRDYPQDAVSREDYLTVFKNYTASHRLTREDGKVVPWIDENLHPYTGDWIARTRLKTWEKGSWSDEKGGPERGKDYNHSTYCDLLISGLVGVCPQPDDSLVVHPLLPEGAWESFCLDRCLVHGRTISVIWDPSGTTYHRGAGLVVLVDGEQAASANELSRLVVPLR